MIDPRICYAPEDGGGSAPPAPAPAPVHPAYAPPPVVPQVPSEPKTFSLDYVRELREENKGYRLKLDETRKEADGIKAAAERTVAEAKITADKAIADAKSLADAAGAEATTKATTAEQRANERVIRAELRTEAIKLGMIDLDGLKLADLSVVKLDDDGNVVGAPEMLAALKVAKPYLFAAPSAHSSQIAAPPPIPRASDSPVDARKMSKDEYEKYKAKVIAGR